MSRTAGKSALQFWWEIVQRKQYQREFCAQWKAAGLDALIAPGLGLPALRHGDSKHLFLSCSYTTLFNLLHFPSGAGTRARA